MENFYIYILRLEQNKYYVGKTKEPNFRIEEHFNNYGSAWTNKFKAIEIIKIIPNCDAYDEDKYTLQMMEKYGIYNVRGGSFCEIKLDEKYKFTINKMLRGSTDKCYNCGKNGHFINNCPYDDEILNNKICDDDDLICPFCDKECKTEKYLDIHINKYCKNVNNCCFRCFREGHYENECYAKTDKHGNVL